MPLFRTWSIRGHLTALVVVTMLPLLVLLVQALVLDTRQSMAVAEQSSRAVAETTAAGVGRFFQEVEAVLAGVASREAVRSMDPEPCSSFLVEIAAVLPRLANLFVVEPGGDVACSALAEPVGGFDPVRDREWFDDVMATGEFHIGSPQMGRISGRWVAVVAGPIRDAEGALVGIVGGAVDLVAFQDFLVDSTLPEGSVLTLDDLDGVVVARSLDADAWIGRALPRSGLPPEFLEGPGGATRVAGAEGVERVWGFAAIEGTPWRAWAGIPVSEVYGPVMAAALHRSILIALALVAVATVSLLLYSRVGRSLRELVEETYRVTAGRGARIREGGPDEVRRVAVQFNRTLAAREEAETERRRSLERYRSVLDHAVFGILVSGADDRIREANPAVAALVGAEDAEELRGSPLSGLFLAPDEALQLRAALEAGTPIAGLQTRWRTREGNAVTVRLHGSVHRDAAGELACEWIVEDLTERLVLEARVREVQKLEAVGRLAGGVAHDFNNLLTVITTSTHLLREEHENDAEIQESTGDILDAAARGAALTRQLLTFSRKQVIQPEPLALNRVVGQMEGLLKRLAGDGIQLSVHLEEGVGWVKADRAQLEQVLLNLVLNARDASEAHGPVGVRTHQHTLHRPLTTGETTLVPGEYAALEVSDQGSGIPDKVRDRIFEPFFSTKPDGKGTGLGLATVYGIVTQAGGGITVESQPGQGTLFRILLPRITPPQ